MESKNTPHQRLKSALASALCFGLLTLTVALAASGCASLPQPKANAGRQARYVASHRELPSDFAHAIEAGRLVLGMNPEQVGAAIGEPDRKTSFHGTASEVWVYRAGRAHVNQLPNGIDAFRLVFTKDRLILIEPL